MKTYHNKKVFTIFILISLIISSCSKDFLDETAYTDVTLDFIYTTPEGLDAAMVSLYNVHRSFISNNQHNSYRALVLPVKSDLAVVRVGEIGLFAWLRWGHSPYAYQGSLVHSFWKHYYKIIDRSNAIIKGAELSNEVSEEMKILLSEARVLRAEAYFTLYRMFNNIYVTTEPTSPDNAFEKIKDKSSEEEIFELIKSDLNYAEQHLPWTNTPGRVNLAMAKHINAKVSMWNQDWQGAINKTEDIFNSGFYSLMDNPADIFDGINNYGPRSSGAVNNETIFNFQFSNPTIGGGIKTMVNWNFTANYGLVRGATYSRDFGGRGAGWVFPNQYLLSLYDENDLRTKDIYFRLKFYFNDQPNLPAGVSVGDEITNPVPFSSQWYQRLHPSCLKYQPFNSSNWDPNVGASQANFIVYRLAETYLIAAEAYMRLNGNSDSNALGYLNSIRTRSGVSPLNYVDQEVILDERARELAFEGQRWYTLKRMGILYDRIVKYAGNDDYKNEARTRMQPHYVNFPIPQNQLDLMDPAYPQNDGYE